MAGGFQFKKGTRESIRTPLRHDPYGQCSEYAMTHYPNMSTIQVILPSMKMSPDIFVGLPNAHWLRGSGRPDIKFLLVSVSQEYRTLAF